LAASPGLRFFGTVNRDRRQRPPSDEPYGGECLVRVPPPGPGAAWRSSSACWPATAGAMPCAPGAFTRRPRRSSTKRRLQGRREGP